MFNLNQFKNEPLRADLLLALFEKKLLNVTVLKVNKQIFASVATMGTGDWLHLSTGINIHAPFNAKFYSPGFVHFNLLVQQLMKDRVSIFDLSPGGDFYKERLANKHDQVYELVITNSVLYRIKRELRKQYHEMLLKAGKWPMGTELSASKKIYLLKARINRVRKQGLLSTALERTKDLVKPSKDKLYILKERLDTKNELLINKNNLKHLLDFETEGTLMTRWEFLEDAMRRFEVGQNCYTFYESGRLLCCAWISQGAKASRVGVKQGLIKLPEGAALLQGVSCHPAGGNMLSDFLLAVTLEVITDAHERKVYAISNSKDKTICQILEAIGFASADNTSG
jgi:hypothetical protein